MNWLPLLVVAALVAGVFILKQSGRISPMAARKLFRQGALVIDVRTANEFNSGHLPQALNIPLGQIETVVPKRVPDKNQALLLHCLSGTRSGIAQRQLKALGYPNVFNLGSYNRAKAILIAAD